MRDLAARAWEEGGIEPFEELLVGAGYPPSLAKACWDKAFDYQIGLRDGTVVRFMGASVLDGGWVSIHGITMIARIHVQGREYERGVDVRLSDIMWASDGPRAG